MKARILYRSGQRLSLPLTAEQVDDLRSSWDTHIAYDSGPKTWRHEVVEGDCKRLIVVRLAEVAELELLEVGA